MYDVISVFQVKLDLWEKQLRPKNFTHFPILTLQQDITQKAANKYTSSTSHLNLEFENRFQYFKETSCAFCASAMPFAVDVSLLPWRLQMELCEMCCDTELKEQFHQVSLEDFCKMYLDKDKYSAFQQTCSVDGFAIWKHLCVWTTF